MRIFQIKFINFILIPAYIFLSARGYAGIVEKGQYSIQPKIKYKDSLNIVILPFTGEISEERKYVKDLIKNSLADNILLFKKIRYPYSFIDSRTNAFKSTGKAINGTANPSSRNGDNEKIHERFLDVKLIEDKEISIDKIDKKITSLDSTDLNAVPGTDIIITGTFKQDINNLKIKIKVINNIYGKVFIIEKEGTFKNIDQLLEYLSHEVIKAVIIQYSYVNVSSNEKDAAIYIDDRYFGRTDRSGILLESGIHKIVLSKTTYAEKTTTVNFTEKSTESLRIEFNTKDVFPKNNINITTEPDKAKIYFDSDFIGLSPIVKNDLPDGTYRVRIEKEGYITKYQTIEVRNGKESKKDLAITLEKGDSKQYYFTRTSAYNNLFIISSFGIVIGSASYLYFGLQINDQNAKQNSLSTADPNYSAKKNKIDDRKDKFKFYQQISLYTAGAMIISAGIFYYLDKAQDDISIAFYLPQSDYFSDKSFITNPSLLSPKQKGIGLIFTKSF